MDRHSLFGGNPLSVIIKLALLSIVVGVVMSALGITPADLLYRLDLIVKRLYDLGFGAVEWIFQYFLVGAVVVIPIWLVVRAFGLAGKGSGKRNDTVE